MALPDVSDDEGDDSVDSAQEEAVSCNIFSERELMFMFAICRRARPSVCLSVVCL